jgi:Ca-activated chloride channel family protein
MIWMLSISLILLGLLFAELRCRQQQQRLTFRPSYRTNPLLRLLPDFLMLVAIILLLVPIESSQPIRTDSLNGPAVALVVDVSRSMQTKDVEPDRLNLAKRTLLALIEHYPSARFALIPFAGEAVLQVPLTSDRDGLRFFINNLHTGLIAAKGSAPEEAILLAQRNMDTVKGEKLILLLTDGERTIAEQPPQLSKTIPVYSILTGTTRGGPVNNNKNSVSRADPKRLHAIARQTGGKMLKKQLTSFAISDLPIKKTAIKTNRMTTLFLIIALILVGLRWLPIKIEKNRALSLGILFLTLLFPGCKDLATDSLDPQDQFKTGLLAAQNKETAAALTAFAAATKSLDGVQRSAALYNQGTLLLNTGHPSEAVTRFEQALILMPKDEMIRENFLLALAQTDALISKSDGDSKQEEVDRGNEMSPQQAQHLIETVQLDPKAAPIEATILPPTVLKEW